MRWGMWQKVQPPGQEHRTPVGQAHGGGEVFWTPEPPMQPKEERGEVWGDWNMKSQKDLNKDNLRDLMDEQLDYQLVMDEKSKGLLMDNKWGTNGRVTMSRSWHGLRKRSRN